MTRRETYLDWNAPAPPRPEAVAAVTEALAHGGNPSSVHRRGRAARQRIERARAAVTALVGAEPDGMIFVSGGTEANHLALLGKTQQHRRTFTEFGVSPATERLVANDFLRRQINNRLVKRFDCFVLDHLA